MHDINNVFLVENFPHLATKKNGRGKGPKEFLEKIAPNDLLIMHHKINCFE
jgi:hypothetical protein